MSKKEGLLPTAPANVDPVKHIITQKNMLDQFLVDAHDIVLAGPLVKYMVNLFVATSGSGKSLLAFLVAWHEIQAGQFKHVFYVDLDNPNSIWKDRYSNFAKHPGFFYLTEYILLKIQDLQGSMPVDKAWNFINALASSEYAPDSLVVIDSLQNVVDYNDRKELSRLFDICRAITFQGGTVLIIHHKSSKMESPAFKGLSLIKDFADIMWEVTPDRKKNGEIANFKLTCVKNRSVTSFANFLVSFDTDIGSVNYDQNVLTVDELPVKDAVLDILQDNELKQGELIDNIKKQVPNIGEKRIRSILAKLVALNVVEVKQLKTAKVYNLPKPSPK